MAMATRCGSRFVNSSTTRRKSPIAWPLCSILCSPRTLTFWIHDAELVTLCAPIYSDIKRELALHNNPPE